MFSNLTQTIYTILYLLALCLVFILPGAKLYLASVKYVGNRPPTTKDCIISIVPYLNTLETRKVYYGKIAWHNIATAVCVAIIAIRVVVVTAFYDNSLLMLFSVLVVWLAICALYITITIINLNVATMLECSGLVKAMCVIIAPVGVFWLATQVKPFFKNNKEEINNTFLTEDE